MFSLAATALSELESSPSRKPVEAPRANASLPADPRNFPSTFGSNANRLPGALNPESVRGQFSVNGRSDPSSSRPAAGFLGVGGWRFGQASGANSPANPVLANQQPASLSTQQPAATVSTPLASGVQSDWSIVNSPNALVPKASLHSVTCVSASDCWAVGSSFSGSVTQTLIEHWDGTSWAIVTSPNTSTTLSNGLVGVTCVSASDCWAVGFASNSSADQTLVEHWDGISWAIVPSPSPVAPPPYATLGTNLASVTCVSASDCWAVGYYEEIIMNPPSGQSQTLIEHWDGASWAIVTSANTSPTANNVLEDVACVSASDCWAVGAFTGANPEETLIERWDGTSWAIVTSPTILGSENSLLFGVTCVSASNCWAVGQSSNFQGGQTLVEHWDGTSWVVVTSPNTSAAQSNDTLSRVTCVTASDCWAVGYSISSSAATGGVVVQTLFERWDGTSWAIVTSPNTSATDYNFLSGLTCVSTSDCWAVGYASTSTGSVTQTLVERWDGASWTIVTSANTLSQTTSILYGVTCVSASNCWAVGYSFNGANYQTLVERWDGTSWAVVTSANASDVQNNVLYGVTCVSASDCWAVGYAVSFNEAIGYTYQTLIERWDGTSWAIVISPNPLGNGPSILYGVTCVSASDCWAVGYSSNGIHLQTLIERWDGTSWVIVTSANNLPTQDNVLNGVTCVSASDCWAVGYYLPTAGVYQTLVERWDGTSWAVITSPNTSTTQNDVLNGVTCASASDCWAAGYYHNGSNYQTLTEQWNGTSWAIVTSANTSATQDNVLIGVTCVSASDCWAVGESYNGTAVRTVTERWDGTSWATVTSPNTSDTQNNVLSAVTCVSASECWAVGSYRNGRTLVLRYTPSPPIPTSVVSRKTHGSVGDFDVDLPLIGNPGIECRSGLVSGNHRVIVTFASAVTLTDATVTPGQNGTASLQLVPGANHAEVLIDLSNVSNAQTLTINLGVSDGTNTGDLHLPMAVLLGDVDASRRTDAGDVTQVRNHTVSIPDQQTFRFDVNTSGRIDAGDVTVTRNASVTVLP
jgi:hypothetical protein